MINFTGEFVATSDVEMLSEYLNKGNSSLVYCGDPADIPDEFVQVNAINGVAFVPDYNCLQYYVNGNSAGFITAYRYYLESSASTTLMCTILKALTVGRNVILFFPKETLELGYPSILLSYILGKYGVQPRTKNSNFIFNQTYNDTVLMLMAQCNTITYAEMFLNLIQPPHLTEANVTGICGMMAEAINDELCDYINFSPNEGMQYIANGINILRGQVNPSPAFGTV